MLAQVFWVVLGDFFLLFAFAKLCLTCLSCLKCFALHQIGCVVVLTCKLLLCVSLDLSFVFFFSKNPLHTQTRSEEALIAIRDLLSFMSALNDDA